MKILPKRNYSTRTASLQRIDAKKKTERDQYFEKITETVPKFEDFIFKHKNTKLERAKTTIFQVNIGKICNLVITNHLI